MPSAPRPHRRTNVYRTEAGKTFDAPYLASLSAEWYLRYYELSLSRTNEAGAASKPSFVTALPPRSRSTGVPETRTALKRGIRSINIKGSAPRALRAPEDSCCRTPRNGPLSGYVRKTLTTDEHHTRALRFRDGLRPSAPKKPAIRPGLLALTRGTGGKMWGFSGMAGGYPQYVVDNTGRTVDK
jgi:hypothetical protein